MMKGKYITELVCELKHLKRLINEVLSFYYEYLFVIKKINV